MAFPKLSPWMWTLNGLLNDFKNQNPSWGDWIALYMFEYERTWHGMQIPGIVCTLIVPYTVFYSSAGQWDQINFKRSVNLFQL